MPLPYIDIADGNYYAKTGDLLIDTKAVGVTFEDRQTVISIMPKKCNVTLMPEENSPAIAVYFRGSKIGCLNKEIAEKLNPFISEYDHEAKAEVIGKNSENIFGVRLNILIKNPSAADNKQAPKKKKFSLSLFFPAFFLLALSVNYSNLSKGIISNADFSGRTSLNLFWMAVAFFLNKYFEKKMNIFLSLILSLVLGLILIFIIPLIISLFLSH